MATDHAFCTIHRMAYNRRLDPICPQCTLARIPPGQQLDYDIIAQRPLSADKTPLDAFTLEPAR